MYKEAWMYKESLCILMYKEHSLLNSSMSAKKEEHDYIFAQAYKTI